MEIDLNLPIPLMPKQAVKGTLARDSGSHYSFVEEPLEEQYVKAIQAEYPVASGTAKKAIRRYPKHLYQGEFVNVVEQPSGELSLSLRKSCSEEKDFTTYCLNVINEISHVVKMLSL